MMSIIGFVHELVACHTFVFVLFEHIWTQEWDQALLERPEVESMLASFRWIRCAYQHFQNPAHHHLLTLSALSVLWSCCRRRGLLRNGLCDGREAAAQRARPVGGHGCCDQFGKENGAIKAPQGHACQVHQRLQCNGHKSPTSGRYSPEGAPVQFASWYISLAVVGIAKAAHANGCGP